MNEKFKLNWKHNDGTPVHAMVLTFLSSFCCFASNLVISSIDWWYQIEHVLYDEMRMWPLSLRLLRRVGLTTCLIRSWSVSYDPVSMCRYAVGLLKLHHRVSYDSQPRTEMLRKLPIVRGSIYRMSRPALRDMERCWEACKMSWIGSPVSLDFNISLL